jgi:hypothetical protein
VSVVCCQVEVSASGWSLVQRSPTDCGVSKKCNREASKLGGLGTRKGAVEPLEKKPNVLQLTCSLINDTVTSLNGHYTSHRTSWVGNWSLCVIRPSLRNKKGRIVRCIILPSARLFLSVFLFVISFSE